MRSVRPARRRLPSSIYCKVTDMLQQHDYVVLFIVDFSKAFDSVKHQSLFEKMESLQLPDHIHNWLVRYFESRGHVTPLGDIISTIEFINASIVQTSEVRCRTIIVCYRCLRSSSAPFRKPNDEIRGRYLRIGWFCNGPHCN